VLNVVVEGTKDPGEAIRFEAFIHQAREHLGKKKILIPKH
jgi:hypothetical protein